ncbi:MAG: hypothetical protein M0Z77_01010 [Thermoplasmatales archaeon]|nr:hypothetical protein [Thermoplasmatales archaeon]
MISEEEIEKRKEAVLLSQLNQNHIEAAISLYPYDHFHAKNIRVQLQKMYDLVIDEEEDPDRVIGCKIGKVFSALLESGHIRELRRGHSNHGILYGRK